MSIYHRKTKCLTVTYDIGDDAHEKQVLLMLVGALLFWISKAAE